MIHKLKGISARIIAGILIIQLVMVPLLFGGVLYMVEKNYIERFIEHVRSDALLLVSGELDTGDYLELQDQIENAVLTGRISFGTAILANGDHAAHEDLEIGRPNFIEDFTFNGHQDSTYNIVVSVQDSSHGIVELRLGYDEIPTREQINLIYRRGVLLALAYLLATTSVMLFLGRKITHPIRYLESASRKIAHGHYEGSLKVDTGIKELSSLSESLDDMRHELVMQSQSMQHQALHDILTGLPNRSLLFDRMSQALLAGRRDQHGLAVLLIDLDNFKEVNDTLGHHAGDIILKLVSERLIRCTESADTVARLGGDEFCIVLSSANWQAANMVAENILTKMQHSFAVDHHKLFVGASIGIARYPDHGDDFETLLKRADLAMYVAKEERDGLRWYTPELENTKRHQLAISSELRMAIDNDELLLHFQPKMELSSGRVTSAECLLRWQHPERGLIPPDEFIPIAEKTGLIHPLTKWVLREAIAQCGRWQESGIDLHLAVNFSAYNLNDENMPSLIATLLKQHGVPATRLEIELTESAIFSDPVRALDILQRISNMGIVLSIDDFGTGYSSLYQLRRLPVDQIKIDRSFITDMSSNENDAAIVRATIHLAHELGLVVIAEGVEDQQTLDTLQQKGCELAQGYFISRPLPAREFVHWLKKWVRKTPHNIAPTPENTESA